MSQGDVAAVQEALLGSQELRAEFRVNPHGFLSAHGITLDPGERARLEARRVGELSDTALVEAIRENGLAAMW